MKPLIRPLILSILFFSAFSTYAKQQDRQTLVVGQGIVLPSNTNFLSYKSSYVTQSPIGSLNQGDIRISAGHYESRDGSGFTGNYSTELGTGSDDWGIAVGADQSCEDCDLNFTGAVAIKPTGSTALGLAYSGQDFSLGLRYELGSAHQLGFLLNGIESALNESSFTYGAGYAYVGSSWAFDLEASSTQNSVSQVSAPIQISAGFIFQGGPLEVSLTYNSTLTEDSSSTGNSNNLWVGLGFEQDSWAASLYIDYVSDILVSGSFFF